MWRVSVKAGQSELNYIRWNEKQTKDRTNTSRDLLNFIYRIGGCPLRGKSLMCMMCLKYRIILLIVIETPWKYLLTYYFSGAPPRTPLGRLQLTSDPQLVCSPPSVVPTLKISLALHLPCRHLAINLAYSGADI